MNQVQSYINECFEMEEMPENNCNNNESTSVKTKPVIHEQQQQQQDLPSVAILPIEKNNQQQIIETRSQFTVTPVNNNNRVMTIPTIHITNEHGQDRRISIDANHNCVDTKNAMNINNNEQQKQPKVAIVIKNVSFSYTKKTNVLSNINLVVPKGIFFLYSLY
ncbi:hypothetical protein BLA29_012004 [Euroglyphus maynei]|uniref:Uncharacterized protein n=1 Tax=Euroglyphus maynei TaxID=6958 RepID=A0A1Y3B586_EURMA|nr:hypothetical protein BLA29_012004 [Euroglyphus maynei]